MDQETLDELRAEWLAMSKGHGRGILRDPLLDIIKLLASQCQMLEEIRDELRQMNQANDPDPEAEPDPFQTLNGPRL